ncbi:MAG: hypothetical protein HY812_07840 [Planctomycetes bacterium]|nr:hypothetical protein [Planctomycetota bacterium]
MHSLPARLLLALASSLVFFSAAEFATTTLDVAPGRQSPLVIWDPTQDRVLYTEEGEFRFHPYWLWEPRPGIQVHGAPINECAYRGPSYSRRKGVRLRIATMGDSTTYGYKLPEENAWPRVLEEVLRAHGYDVEVLNFGVIGFTSVQGRKLYEGRVRDYAPDIVVAAFGAVNDIQDVPAGMTDLEKIAVLSKAGRRVHDFLQRYDFYRWLDALLVEKPDAADPGSPKAPQGSLTQPRVPLDVFQDTLRGLAQDVARDGGRLVLVSPPRRHDGEQHIGEAAAAYTAAIHRVAELEGLPLAEVRDEFLAIDRASLGADAGDAVGSQKSDLYLDGWHPTPKGHRVYAVTVAMTLDNAGLLGPAQVTAQTNTKG